MGFDQVLRLNTNRIALPIRNKPFEIRIFNLNNIASVRGVYRFYMEQYSIIMYSTLSPKSQTFSCRSQKRVRNLKNSEILINYNTYLMQLVRTFLF